MSLRIEWSKIDEAKGNIEDNFYINIGLSGIGPSEKFLKKEDIKETSDFVKGVLLGRIKTKPIK